MKLVPVTLMVPEDLLMQFSLQVNASQKKPANRIEKKISVKVLPSTGKKVIIAKKTASSTSAKPQKPQRKPLSKSQKKRLLRRKGNKIILRPHLFGGRTASQMITFPPRVVDTVDTTTGFGLKTPSQLNLLYDQDSKKKSVKGAPTLPLAQTRSGKRGLSPSQLLLAYNASKRYRPNLLTGFTASQLLFKTDKVKLQRENAALQNGNFMPRTPSQLSLLIAQTHGYEIKPKKSSKISSKPTSVKKSTKVNSKPSEVLVKQLQKIDKKEIKGVQLYDFKGLTSSQLLSKASKLKNMGKSSERLVPLLYEFKI